MSRRNADRLLALFSGGAAAISGSLVLLVALVIAVGAWPGLVAIGPGAFLASADWRPSAGRYGAWAMIAGTLAVTTLAVALAVPLGGLAGIASGWLWPARTGNLLRALWQLMAGVPSVVLGLWGLTVLVPLLARWQPPGASLLAAALVLAVMIVPTVAVVADAALRSVPVSTRQVGQSLGLSRWGNLRCAAAPTLLRALLTGGVLATARAVGETMAVLLVAGNVVQVPDRVTDPVRTLTGGIALELAYASGTHRSALFVLGLLSLAVVVLLLMTLHRLVGRPAGGLHV